MLPRPQLPGREGTYKGPRVPPRARQTLFPDAPTALMAKLQRQQNAAEEQDEKPALLVIRLHDLCHLHATLLLKAGVPAHVVAERLEHARPRHHSARLRPRPRRPSQRPRDYLRTTPGQRHALNHPVRYRCGQPSIQVISRTWRVGVPAARAS